MDFNIELKTFPSALHSSIYSFARRIVPLSYTLDSVQDHDMRSSCAALHAFVMDMLSDMYDNPEAYHLPVMKLEEYYAGRQPLDVKRESPKKFKKVFAQTSHAASQYEHLLLWIGYGGTMDGENAIMISAERLQDIGKRVSTNVSPIKLNKRMEALNRIGLMMETLPSGEGRFTSKKYHNMLPALHALANSPRFDKFDFRNLNGEYKPTQNDHFISLFAEQREIAQELHNIAIEHKMRSMTDVNNGVNYIYKGKQVMEIGTGDDIECFLDIKVICKDRKDNLSVIDSHMKKESQHLQEQARQHLMGCDAGHCIMCSTYCSDKYVTVLDKCHQICGTGVIGFSWRRDIEADITVIKRLIEIRREIIDDAKKVKT